VTARRSTPASPISGQRFASLAWIAAALLYLAFEPPARKRTGRDLSTARRGEAPESLAEAEIEHGPDSPEVPGSWPSTVT